MQLSLQPHWILGVGICEEDQIKYSKIEKLHFFLHILVQHGLMHISTTEKFIQINKDVS